MSNEELLNKIKEIVNAWNSDTDKSSCDCMEEISDLIDNQ